MIRIRIRKLDWSYNSNINSEDDIKAMELFGEFARLNFPNMKHKKQVGLF